MNDRTIGHVDIEGHANVVGDRNTVINTAGGNVYIGAILSSETPCLPFHNLPNPDYVEFVGREQEISELQRLLLPTSRAWLVTIDGIGGIGKSSLALEIGHYYHRRFNQSPPEEQFTTIVWVSAKNAVLTTDSIQSRLMVFRTLEDIYTAIAVTIRRDDILSARREEQNALICRALAQQRALLIIDNLETVDDERVLAFLRDLPSPTKAIVTTRHRIDVAYPMRLLGMPEPDALKLIARETLKRDIILTTSQAQRLFERTGGVPLAMVWSVAQMAYDDDIEVVLRRLSQPTENINRFIFEASIQHIRHKPAYQILAALAFFETDASREALGQVAGLPELDRDDALRELEVLSLVNKRGPRFSLATLTKAYAQSLPQSEDWVSGARDRWLSFFIDAFQEYAVYADLLAQGLNPADVEVEKDNALAALAWCMDNRQFVQAIALADRLSIMLNLAIMVEQSIEVINLGITAALDLNDERALCNFRANLGLRYGWQDQHELAEQELLLAEALSRKNENYKLDNVLDYRGSNFMRWRKYTEARPVLEESLVLREQMADRRLAVLGRFVYGILFYRQERYEDALPHLHKALAEAEKIQYARGVSFIKNYLGNIALRKGQYTEAQEYLDAALLIAQQLHDRRRIARLLENKSDLEKLLGHHTSAREYALASLHIFEQLGLQNDYLKVQRKLSEMIGANDG